MGYALIIHNVILLQISQKSHQNSWKVKYWLKKWFEFPCLDKGECQENGRIGYGKKDDDQII